MTRKPLCKLWISSCTEDGGAYSYRLENDTLIFDRKIPMKSPMWLEKRGDALYALLRAPFTDNRESAVFTYRLTTGEALPLLSTKGEVACHMAIDGSDVYVANYISGSLTKLQKRLVLHSGKGKDPVRQEAPHVHSVFFSPDKRYILSCDLGLDTVFVYDRDLNEIGRASVPSGSGPRHLVFSKDGNYVYVVNEMGASVSVFSYSDGALTYCTTHSLLDGDAGMGSAIRLSKDGKRLYVSERKTNRLFVFEVNGEKLTEIYKCSCFGDGPRDFDLVMEDAYLVVTNQWSGNLSLFRTEKDGILTYLNSTPLPQAISVTEE